MKRTIFTRAKHVWRAPTYVRVVSEGDIYNYKYETFATRKDRNRLEIIRREQGEPALYNINVYPR